MGPRIGFLKDIVHSSCSVICSKCCAVPIRKYVLSVTTRNNYLYCPISGRFSADQSIVNDEYRPVLLHRHFGVLEEHIICLCLHYFPSAGQWPYLVFFFLELLIRSTYFSTIQYVCTYSSTSPLPSSSSAAFNGNLDVASATS